MEQFDIADFRRAGLPDCRYIFAVIIDTPKYDVDYYYKPMWKRLFERLCGLAPKYVYFHIGQIVICDTDTEWASPREAAWGAKPGKHYCPVKKFTDLEKAISCAEDVINGEIENDG